MAEINTLTDPSATDAAIREQPPESARKTLWADIRHGGRLIKQYVKADPLIGTALLVGQLGSGALASVMFLQMQVNLAAITNALAAHNGGVINGLLMKVLLASIVMAAVGMLTIFAQLAFRIRFRRVLTDNLVTRWMAGNRYYQLERRGGLDYPEQRIQEDIYQFIERLMSIGPMMIFSFFGIFLYTGQLWRLSPPIGLAPIGLAQPIPGFLVYAAFAFAILWTIITHLVGRSLTRVEVVRQRLEAQFRQEMGAVRENAESIAFARGSAIEERRLTNTFGLIRRNWRFFTWANLKINFVQGLPGSFMLIGPTLLCAPFVLKGQMQIGDITLVAASFGQVYSGVGIIISQYNELAILRSSVARLRLLDERLSEEIVSDIVVTEKSDPNIQVRGLKIDYPDGKTMTMVGDLEIAPGKRLLVQGRSGAGKSTLLRAIAGLWPYGRGQVGIPEDATIAFLPQRGYMPNSSLAGLMSYPHPPETHSDGVYFELLETLGLERLASRLHDYQPWSRILSPGEQQRIAAARAVLSHPDFLFVDEATSALDPQSEKTVYNLFAERLPAAALISVAHRPSVVSFHDTVLRLENGEAHTSSVEALDART